MDACEAWLAADFFHRHGYRLTVHSDGRRTASIDGVTYVLPGCSHPPEQCPPHQAEQRIEVAA